MDRTPHRIDSPHNQRFKELRRLLAAKGIRRRGLALVAGPRLTAEALSRHPARCRAWLTPLDGDAPPAGAPADLEWVQLAPALFRELDVLGTHAPLVLLKVPAPEAWDPASGLPPGASLMVPFQDPENAGAVIRSAVAFGVDQIILLRESAHPYHPKTLRASGGAVLRARLREGPALEDLPPDPGVVPLSGEGTDIAAYAFPDTFALLPGLEGPGLPEAWRKSAVSIPIRPEVESLNGAAAVAVALYLWSRGRG
jgi:tRNA G18 (ribose-2'-O)-methylase SpoU